MANVHDVAAYILQNAGEMTAMKLQKLVYYSQAWSLVWDEKPLFPEQIEAWVNGPVVPELYFEHRGRFKVSTSDKGNAELLTEEERETINAIVRDYGKYTSQQLSEMTHREAPWLDARRGLAPLDRGSNVIDHASLAEYYGSL